MPQYFKRPHEFYEHRSVERRVLVRQTPEPVEPPTEESEELPVTCEASTQSDDPLAQEIHSLKERNVQLIMKYISYKVLFKNLIQHYCQVLSSIHTQE